jgi:hypothetical protein
MFNYNAEYNPETNAYTVLIASAGVEAKSLYGSGTLFNILAKPNMSVPETLCGPLNLLEQTRLYDVESDMSKPLDLELEDGQLCVTGGCIHGDADKNLIVDSTDAQYVLDFWVKKVPGNVV